MPDSDIAVLLEVETKNLNRQMNRNKERFPVDFCFKPNSKEFKNLRCQNVTFNCSTKGSGSTLLITSQRLFLKQINQQC